MNKTRSQKAKKVSLIPDGEITLLTIEQAEKLPQYVLRFSDIWWLRSPGGSSSLVAVCSNGGYVLPHGSSVYYSHAFRPALCDLPICAESVGGSIGQSKLGGIEFEFRPEIGMWLARESIGVSSFGEATSFGEANCWETSTGKQFVENWYARVFCADGERSRQ